MGDSLQFEESIPVGYRNHSSYIDVGCCVVSIVSQLPTDCDDSPQVRRVEGSLDGKSPGSRHILSAPKLFWEVLNGVGVDGVGGIFPFFTFFFVFLRFSSFFFAFVSFC